MRLASGAYQTALDRADTVQGECAVYRRVLRQLGEVYAAKQRLGVDPELEIPFTIEGAIEVYAKLALVGDDGWQDLGYRATGRESYIDGDARSLGGDPGDDPQRRRLLPGAQPGSSARGRRERAPRRAPLRALPVVLRALRDRRAARRRSRLGLLRRPRGREGRGRRLSGVCARIPLPDEVELATRRYRSALTIFPFDRRLWPALTGALERQGREPEYMELVRPVADWVARSRSVDTWIAKAEPGAETIATLRRALSDSLVIMYLGFGEDAGIEQLEQSVRELRAEREGVASQLAELERERGAEPGARARRGGRRPGRAGAGRGRRRARPARLRGAHAPDRRS